MKLSEYDAYDICINDQNERFIVLYKVSLESEDADYYEKTSIECFESSNLKEDIKALRDAGYFCISEFGFEHEPIDSDNPLATMYFTLKGSRLVALEKIYFPEIKFGMSYIFGAINFIDVITGNEYIVRTKKFGLETDENIEFVESLGYIHISNTNFKNGILNDSLIHKLQPKRK